METPQFISSSLPKSQNLGGKKNNPEPVYKNGISLANSVNSGHAPMQIMSSWMDTYKIFVAIYEEINHVTCLVFFWTISIFVKKWQSFFIFLVGNSMQIVFLREKPAEIPVSHFIPGLWLMQIALTAYSQGVTPPDFSSLRARLTYFLAQVEIIKITEVWSSCSPFLSHCSPSSCSQWEPTASRPAQDQRLTRASAEALSRFTGKPSQILLQNWSINRLAPGVQPPCTHSFY